MRYEILLNFLTVYLSCNFDGWEQKITLLFGLLGYIFAQSASLFALLFVIINIYSVYSIYFGVGHFNFIQGYMIYKYVCF